MTKGIYNYDKLMEYCCENKIILLKDYNEIKVTRDTVIIGKCFNVDCCNEFNKLFRNLLTYGSYCSNCALINRKNKCVQTCIERYGVKNSFQSDIIKQKIKQTNYKKYSVDNPNYSKEIQEQKKIKCFEKYGVKCTLLLPHVIKNRKNTFLHKYGNEFYLKTDFGKETFVNTCVEKYNVINPSQSSDISHKKEKNSYKRKIYIFPSGKELICQGYEPFALDKLIKEDNICENDIITGCKNVPQIWYYDENNKKHRHYVDIFIPSQNRCIEVKSTWTAEKKKDNIYLKQNAAKELGYNYEIWIYNNKKELVEIIV